MGVGIGADRGLIRDRGPAGGDLRLAEPASPRTAVRPRPASHPFVHARQCRLAVLRARLLRPARAAAVLHPGGVGVVGAGNRPRVLGGSPGVVRGGAASRAAGRPDRQLAPAHRGISLRHGGAVVAPVHNLHRALAQPAPRRHSADRSVGRHRLLATGGGGTARHPPAALRHGHGRSHHVLPAVGRVRHRGGVRPDRSAAQPGR